VAHRPTVTRIALAVAVAMSFPLGAWAQGSSVGAPATGEATKDGDELKLDNVVVTGTAIAGSKMRQSLSISTLSSAQIQQQGAASSAELLRSVPGVRSESTGGEGNANITVRGVPISAGGARYVQLQEDGLPVLLFGDIAFGTADQFLRADFNVDRLEVVRGGSASTLATNSPGGLINFISKTGEERGGAVGLGLGLDFRQTRVDFDFGTRLGERSRMHVGGFYRRGEGDGRDVEFTAQKGGQLKANFTQELGRNDYIRVSIKALDDRTPTFLPVPVQVVGGEIREVPGIDPRTAFFITRAFPQDVTLNKDGGFTTSDPKDGLRVKSNALGLEGGFDLATGLRIENRFRYAQNDGRFIGLFPSNNGNTAQPGTFNGVLFNTSLDSLDNLFNDLKLTQAVALGGGKLNATGGLFYGTQDVAQTWYWNQYTIELKGESPRILGLAGQGPTTFGGCCVRTWDVTYKTLAPYLALGYETGPLNVDVSVRRDSQRADGFTLEDIGTLPGAWNPASRQRVDYKVNKTSYSAGANYALTRDLAFFGRYSEGFAFSADRLLYGNPLDGSVPINVNEVAQFEGGAKWRSGGLSLFATLFSARTKESNYEVTTQTFTSNRYRANGLELEAGARFGDLRLTGGATYTDAEITGSGNGANVGNTPRRQAKLVYQVQPVYDGGRWQAGGSMVGTTKSFGDDANTITMPAFVVFNAFFSFDVLPNLTVGLAANNVFNETGYTEVEGSGHAARSINGRTVKTSIKYSF
jgi:outer membrane receptor protein involved in Fe transport